MTMRTRDVYHSVIQDVINNVRPQFFNGPGENILDHLQATWEGKMIQAGILGTPAVDLNVRVFPPSPLHAPVQPQQPLPGTGGNLLYESTPTAGVSYMQPPYPTGAYMQSPYPTMTSQTWQTSDGGFIHQQGGRGGVVKIEDKNGGSSSSTSVKVEGGSSNSSTSVKVEGASSSSSTSVELPGVRVDFGDVELPLNEDDDEPDDPEEGEEELNAQNLVLAQFEKVTRTKSKWKCTLKNGIMHLNNKDVLFHECKGEFDF